MVHFRGFPVVPSYHSLPVTPEDSLISESWSPFRSGLSHKQVGRIVCQMERLSLKETDRVLGA